MDTMRNETKRARGVLVPAAAAAAALVLVGTVLLVAVDLPDPVVTHWDPDGVPDGWTPAALVPWMAALIIAAVTGALLVVSRLIHESARHLWAGLTLGTTALLAVLCYAIPWTQRLGPDGVPGEVPLGAVIALAVVSALLLGGGLAWYGRPRVAGEERDPLPRALPADADVLDVPAGARVAWSGRARPSGLTLGLYALIMLGAAVLLWVAVAPWAVVLVLVPAVAVLPLLTARVFVGEPGLRVASLGGLVPWVRVETTDVEVAGTTAVRPIGDFGGWGMRVAPDGRRGYITRAGTALEVRRVGLPSVFVTVDDADGAAATLNTLLAARPGRGPSA